MERQQEKNKWTKKERKRKEARRNVDMDRKGDVGIVRGREGSE